jgi:hypothetical protein
MLVLSGQSNALGGSVLSALSNAPLHTITPDMRRTFVRSFIFSPYRNVFEHLVPGTNNLAAGDTAQTLRKGFYPPSFGVETGYAQLWEQEHRSGDFFAVKQVRDAGIIDNWNTQPGSTLSVLVNRFNAAKAELLSVGAVPAVKAFVWIQGESDNTTSVADYELRLKDLLNNLRVAGVIQPATRVLLVGLKAGGNPDVAKQNVAAADPANVRFVSTTDLPTYDGVHYDAAGMAELSQRVYNAAYDATALIIPARTGTGLAAGGAKARSRVEVYPNPAHHSVAVRLPDAAVPTERAFLLDARGRVVRTQAGGRAGAVLTIETAGLAPGVYTLRLLTGAQVLSRRVTLQ